MPEGTFKALADHGELSEIMSADGGDCEAVLDQFAKAGIDVDALAARLQEEGAKSFVNSWNELMGVIASKCASQGEGRARRTNEESTERFHHEVLVDRCRRNPREDPRHRTKANASISSGPKLTAKQMVAGVKKLARDWKYDAVSIGYPGPVIRNRPLAEPHNLGRGWMGFDFEAAFKRPVKVVNDAAMQALGSYKRGKMLSSGWEPVSVPP